MFLFDIEYSGCVDMIKWDGLYVLPIAYAFGLLALRGEIIANAHQHTHSLALFALSFSLLIYFWYWDTEKPGIKSRYSNHSLTVYGAVVGVLASFVILFTLVLQSPVYFLLGVSLAYLAKTLLNAVFGKHITDDTDISLNLIAVYSDVVATIVFAVYCTFSMWFIPDWSNIIFLDCVVIVCYVTIIAIEWYYQLVASAIEKLVP